MGDPLSQEEIDRLMAAAQGGGEEPAAAEETSAAAPEAEAAAGEPQADIEEPVAATPLTGEAPESPEAVAEPAAEPVAEAAAPVPQTPQAPEAAAPQLQVVAGPQAAPQPEAPSRPPTLLGATGGMVNTVSQPVQFGPLPGSQETADQHRSINLLLDVKLQLTVELGRKELTIKDALALGPGAVVELERVAGDAVDLYINEKLIARGEVVVIDENFGVRVTEVVSPAERMGRVA